MLVLLSGAIAAEFCTSICFHRHFILYRGIHQHETILFILDIEDLGQPSQSLEHRSATLQEHVLEDIQALLTFALTTSTNVRMCTRQHTLGHEMKLRVEKNVNTQPRMFCCADFWDWMRRSPLINFI